MRDLAADQRALERHKKHLADLKAELAAASPTDRRYRRQLLVDIANQARTVERVQTWIDGGIAW